MKLFLLITLIFSVHATSLKIYVFNVATISLLRKAKVETHIIFTLRD